MQHSGFKPLDGDYTRRP